VVEIDPFNGNSTQGARRSGRFAHEGAWLGPLKKDE